MTAERLRIRIRVEQVVHLLFGGILLLVAANVAGQVAKYFFGRDHVFGFVRLTYLGGEATIPSWYSSSLLLACAVLLAVIAALKSRDGAARSWIGLAAMFAYLSVDEGAAIHELWGTAIQSRFMPSGFLLFAWVIPGSVIVLLVSAIYLRFVLALPAATRRLFFIAAAIFVGGALGAEMVSANYVSVAGSNNFGYAVLVTAEEFAEMTGVLVFLYALLQYLATECPRFDVEVEMPEQAHIRATAEMEASGDGGHGAIATTPPLAGVAAPVTLPAGVAAPTLERPVSRGASV